MSLGIRNIIKYLIGIRNIITYINRSQMHFIFTHEMINKREKRG